MIEIRENAGEKWVLFSDVLRNAGKLDPSAAVKHADALGIERTTLPGNNQKKFMLASDVPRLLSRYKNLKSEGQELLVFLGFSDELPNELPEKSPAKPENTPGKSPVKPPEKNGGKAGESRSTKWGLRLGMWYASPLAAYLALSLFCVCQAVLHSRAISGIIGLGWTEAFGITLLVQGVVILGTVHAGFWGDDAGYKMFLGGFFVYDFLLVGSNFFWDFDPAISGSPTPKGYFQKIIEAVLRLGLSIAFPLAQMFFARLVKRFGR